MEDDPADYLGFRPPAHIGHEEFWDLIADAISELQRRIPAVDAPEYVHPGIYPEADSAERGIRADLEAEDAPRTRESLKRFLATGRRPKSALSVAFFASERLAFAGLFAEALATKKHAPGESDVAPRPISSLGGTIRWLALEVYDGNHFREHRWRNQLPEW